MEKGGRRLKGGGREGLRGEMVKETKQEVVKGGRAKKGGGRKG